MRRATAWVLSGLVFLIVVFFTFPWFCSGGIADYDPTYQGPNESWSACGTMEILLKRDISFAIQIPVSLLLAFGAAYLVRRLVLKGEKRSWIDPESATTEASDKSPIPCSCRKRAPSTCPRCFNACIHH